jgi:hypothetical protein
LHSLRRYDSEDFAGSGAVLDISISENALPGECYRDTPKVYHTGGVTTYRLETNNQLYEGIYYAIINVTKGGATPWTLSKFRRKCQVVPTNYNGKFSSDDASLDRIWYTGAYTVKVRTMTPSPPHTHHHAQYFSLSLSLSVSLSLSRSLALSLSLRACVAPFI